MMTIEKITEFRQLFEDYKKYAKDKGCYVMNINEAKDSLASKHSLVRITLEEFNAFFSE